MVLFGVRRLVPGATIPRHLRAGAAGYDLCALADGTIPALGSGEVSTGIAFAIPDGCRGRVTPFMGLAVSRAINVDTYLIPARCHSEVKVTLINDDKTDFQYKAGDCIAQMVIERVATPGVEDVQFLGALVIGFGGFCAPRRNQWDDEDYTERSTYTVLRRGRRHRRFNYDGGRPLSQVKRKRTSYK